MKTGEKISKLRKENNYSQEQLAEILDVSRQSVSKWESDISFPETDKLIQMSKIFNCSIDYLLKDDVDEEGREIKVKILEVDTTKKNHQYIRSLILTYLSFPPVFGWVVAIFSLIEASNTKNKTQTILSLLGMIVSIGFTVLMAIGIICNL